MILRNISRAAGNRWFPGLLANVGFPGCWKSLVCWYAVGERPALVEGWATWYYSAFVEAAAVFPPPEADASAFTPALLELELRLANATSLLASGDLHHWYHHEADHRVLCFEPPGSIKVFGCL